MTEARDVVAVELAAGAATRFGGGKLTARLGGRPLAAHAATAALACGIPRVVIVLGADGAAVEAALVEDGTLPPAATEVPAWPVTAVVNPQWASGISSSVARGLRAAAQAAPDAEAALILLADQPLVDPGTIARLLAAGVDATVPFAVARRAGETAGHPVLVHRSAWDRAEDLAGDRGFGGYLVAHPDLVIVVEPVADNPDVDTRDDLAAVAAPGEAPPAVAGAAGAAGTAGTAARRGQGRAEAAWMARVRANDAQSARVREAPESGDFYGPVAGIFVADPRRTDDAVLDVLLGLARPDDRWLDIGAGAGRFALPLALRVREVVAVDPSPSMLAALRDGMERHGIANVVPVAGRWPADVAPGATEADVALIAHVGYDIERIGDFLDAMERAARRLCVAVMSARVPSWPAGRFWPPVHREARIELPALAPFVDVLRERGAEPRVVEIVHVPRAYGSRDDLHRWVRHQLFLAEGSERDLRTRELVDTWSVETPDGVLLGHQAPIAHGVVSWEPRRP